MKSKITRSYELKAFICGLFSFACLIGPFIYYSIEALLNEGLVYEKVALAGSVIVVGIMTLVSLVNNIALRSRIWIVLFALYLCLDSFIIPLFVIGACQIANELIFSPLRKHFAQKASINIEIDKRGP